jgi:hypothetical protein
MVDRDVLDKVARWGLIALVIVIATGIGFRLIVPVDRKPIDNQQTDIPERKAQRPPDPVFAAPARPPVKNVQVAAAPRMAPVRPAAPAAKPALVEIPTVVPDEPELPDVERLAAAPHVPTYQEYRLTSAPKGDTPTPEEQARASDTGAVVNLTSSLKLALLKGDKKTAEALVEQLRAYGELAEKGLEVEASNSRSVSVASALRTIREQIRR